MMNLSEDARYRMYRIGAHVAWWGAFGWTVALTWVNITRGVAIPGTFQRVSGICIILLMGLAIALGLALSRMRLANTIKSVFETGMKLAAERQQGLENRMVEREGDRDMRSEERDTDRDMRITERGKDRSMRNVARDDDRYMKEEKELQR